MSTAAGYVTDVTYVPGFYPSMAPTALRHVAALNRVAPPRVADGFRYLELGCGLGRSLTTLAAANPQGDFVGIDVNPEHTASIARDVEAGGLRNVRVVTSSFGTAPDDLGRFDFVALHGIWSWVSQQVREEILHLLDRSLAPGGLVLVSYNAMPGWAHLQPIRGILRQYAALRQGDSLQRIKDALAYLVFIRDKHAKYFDDNPRAAAYVDALLKQDAKYLAHEYLNEHWTSFYFAEVATAFGAAGLPFVGSLPVHTNFWDLCVRPEFQELFRTTTNRLVTEAHKDFCANTAFRWDVYARQPRMLADADARLREADDLRFRVTRPGTTLPWQANLGVVTSTVQGPLYQALLDRLGDRSLRLSEIVAAEAVRATPPADVARAVDAGVAMGLFEVAAGPLPDGADALTGAVLVPDAFNRAILASDALGGRPVTLASRHTGTGHTLGDLEAAMLLEVSERGRDGLADRVAGRLAATGRSLQQQGRTITDPAEQATLVAQACDVFLTSSLPALARLGIVAPA
jgi:SAM-dependent methyltransferase